MINFKTYLEGTGTNAVYLSQLIEEASKESGARIIAVLQAPDISTVVQKTRVPVYAQHVDPVSFGSSTGWVLPESVKAAGASGTLVNHSERRLSMDVVRKTIERAKSVGLDTIACAATPEECVEVAAFAPNYVAIEPPELIGSGKAVSREKPEVVVRARELLPKDVPLLCGAGVSTKEDVLKAEELGCEGVLLASAVLKAKNPREKLRELII